MGKRKQRRRNKQSRIPNTPSLVSSEYQNEQSRIPNTPSLEYQNEGLVQELETLGIEQKPETEETFVLAYPFFYNNGAMGDIVNFFEENKFKLKGMRFMHVNDKFIEKHFLNVGGEPHGEHPRLSWVSYITNRPVIAMIWEGYEAVSRVHKITSTQEESLFWIDDGPTTYSSDSVNRANLDIEMWFRQDSKDWVKEATESKHLVYLLPQGKTYGSSKEPFETLRNDVFCDLRPNLHAYFPTDDMSLVVIKPKAVRTGCVGDILTALESSSKGVRGLKLVRKADFPESVVWSDSSTSDATDGDECAVAVAVVVYFLSPKFHFLRDKPDYKRICFRSEKYRLGSNYIYQCKLGETSLHADFFPYGMVLWVDPVGKYMCGMMFEATLVGLSLED